MNPIAWLRTHAFDTHFDRGDSLTECHLEQSTEFSMNLAALETASLLNQAADTLHAKERELADAKSALEIEQRRYAAALAELAALQSVSAAPQEGKAGYVDIVFDGLPSQESGRFVEVEDSTGKGIRFGKWIKRPDGYWALRITTPPAATDGWQLAMRLESALVLIFPMAKGYAAEHPVGNNALFIESAEQILAEATKTLTALAAAPQSGKKEDGWLPIETAPKDGTAVLGYQRVTEEIWLIAPAYCIHGKWYWFEAHNGNNEYEADLTHWMPIPEPPAPSPPSKAEGES